MRVQGIGPPSASLVFVTELPEEWDTLTPFLNGTDLPTSDWVFLTHLMREDDWPDLEMELNITRPDTIVTIGPAVTRAFLGEIDMENSYGSPYQVGCFVVFPAHSPVHEVEFACDMLRLSLYVDGARLFRPPVVIAPAMPQVPRPPLGQSRLDL
jgi:hypothetical protein